MLDPNMTLVYTALTGPSEALAEDAGAETHWATVREALAHYGVTPDDDEELQAAVELEDAEALASIVTDWGSGERVMLERDRAVLKRAMKAFRKRLKVTILDSETSLSGGPMSSGRKSTIVGVQPPNRYPREVWDHLVRQGRLAGGDRGVYELPPGG